jgi:hypothetical protein
MACEPFFDGCLMRTPPEGSCTRAVDAAELVVQASVAALAPFFCPGSRCETVVGMVTHGPPDVSGFSFVAAWVEEVGVNGDPKVGMPLMPYAKVGVQLWIDGFAVPKVEGGAWTQPESSLLMEASRLAGVIGESWYFSIIDLINQNAPVCSSWSLDTLTPIGPDASFVGWETSFTLDL